MTQGITKQKQRPTATGRTKRGSQALKPRGSRQIAPKKQKLIEQKKLLKKHSAGLTALAEKQLAEKAGHLEMLRGGKKDKEKKK